MSAVDSFRTAMAKSGLNCSGLIVADGDLHRFKADGDHSRNSWYVLHLDSPAAGAFGCWKREIKQTWCERNSDLSQADWQRIRRQWKDAEAKLKAETAARQKKARGIADWILSRGTPVTEHAYLSRKCIKAHGELRQRGDLLILPLRGCDGQLHTIQQIAPDKRFDGERDKTFLKDGRIAGCSFTIADAPEMPLVICEGYATGASIHEATRHATICAMNAGNIKSVAESLRKKYPNREIIIAADHDQFTDDNPGLTKATAAANAIGAKLAVPQFKDVSTKPTDFNDLHQLEGLHAVKSQIDAASIPTETTADTVARLAALTPIEYDQCREAEAKRLNTRASTLDNEVNKLRAGAERGLQGSGIDLEDVELWPEPVDGTKVLDAVSATFSRYLALPKGAADAMTLCAASFHAFEAFEHSPRLCLTSPEKGCGKTTARDVFALFVPRPLPLENLTTATLFRLIERYKPTVLADEYDAWLVRSEELRGILNAGHKRGGYVPRCEGDGNEVRMYRVFAPTVLCGIGALPGTIHDRSIIVRLTRAKPGEVKVRFDSRKTAVEKQLCRRLARWAADNVKLLAEFDPKMPEAAYNRLADNWRPLFAIAEIAGGDWPRRCADAFAALTTNDDTEAQSIGTMLLGDVAAIFAEAGQTKLASARICAALATMEGRPWAEFGRTGKPITPNQLATQLHRFRIEHCKVRTGDQTLWGYDPDDFADAFASYLPHQRGTLEQSA